jgi:HD-like signal output (HDOD) protein
MSGGDKLSIQEVCQRAARLPCSPKLLPRLIEAMRDTESAADRIGDIIRQDTGLAASTLRLANSAAYGREIAIADLTQAIVVLGGREIYRIAAAAMLARWEEEHQDSLPWSPGAFSQHCLAVAVTAEVLADLMNLDNGTSAYTAGLVGDIGRLALAFICAGAYPEIGAEARSGDGGWDAAELRVLGFNSRDIGVSLMRSWNFPPAFITMIELLPNPESAPEADRPFLAQMHAARYLANSLGAAGAAAEFYFEPRPDFLGRHGYTVAVLKTALEKAGGKLRGKSN